VGGNGYSKFTEKINSQEDQHNVKIEIKKEKKVKVRKVRRVKKKKLVKKS
jgi:hypothetical protein